MPGGTLFAIRKMILPCILHSVIVLFGIVFAKSSDESKEPDYYPKVNPNPSNISDLNVRDIDQYFDIFTRFYEIEYKDSAHKKASYDIFTDNLKRIIVMNKFTSTVKFGINEFSHLTIDEFTKKYTGFNDTGIDNTDVTAFPNNNTEGTPLNLDWRKLGVSPLVSHQGACRSSYVFSAIANIEAQVSKNFRYLPRLSEQQAYDCEPTGNCKYGGMPHKVLESIMRVGGIEERINYIHDFKDQRKCQVNESAMVVKVSSIQRFKPDYEDGLVSLLALHGPVVTTMFVSESVKNYLSGVLRPTDCDKKPNHAVLLVGYGITDDEIPYWIIKNSWGIQWGDTGYIRLIRGEWACHIGEYIVTATVEPIPRGDSLTTTSAAASHSNVSGLPLLNSSSTSAAPTEVIIEKTTISSYQKEVTKPNSSESSSSKYLNSTTSINQIHQVRAREENDSLKVINSAEKESANKSKPPSKNEKTSSSENKPSPSEKNKSSEENQKSSEEKKKSSEKTKKSFGENKISSEENRESSLERTTAIILFEDEKYRAAESNEESAEETTLSVKKSSLEINQRAFSEAEEKASSAEDSDNYGLKVTKVIDVSEND